MHTSEIQESPAAVAPVARPRRLLGWPRSAREWLVRAASVVVVLAAWQLYAPHVNPIFLRPPSAVVRSFADLLQDGT
ncbi:MAG TPA: hypothetical protein VGO86_18785, partial [Candidatus Dormibacteraeota bacterium]